MVSAQAAKNDEFYTQLSDIEVETVYYRNYFEGKTIFLNCDDPEMSNFWKHFSYNFDFLGLKGLISTHYTYGDDEGPAYMLRYESQSGSNKAKIVKKELKGDGDFRSKECIELLEEADIVITNPPFSLWREYLSQLIEYDKKFLILGNFNAITYQDVFPLFKNNKLWLGVTRQGSGSMWFRVPHNAPDKSGQRIDDLGNKYQTIGSTAWFTNMDHKARHEEMVLTRFYEGNEDQYPKYDNYDAIEVKPLKNMPMDYEGIMGVPITFIGKYNPDQFEILGSRRYAKSEALLDVYTGDVVPPEKDKKTTINGKETYDRIFIKNKKPISRREMLGF